MKKSFMPAPLYSPRPHHGPGVAEDPDHRKETQAAAELVFPAAVVIQLDLARSVARGTDEQEAEPVAPHLGGTPVGARVPAPVVAGLHRDELAGQHGGMDRSAAETFPSHSGQRERGIVERVYVAP